MKYLILLPLLLYLCKLNVSISKLQINISDCSIKLLIDNNLWLESSKELWITDSYSVYSTVNSTLRLKSVVTGHGQNSIGRYNATYCNWITVSNLNWQTNIKIYSNGVYEFTQIFPNGANKCNVFGANGILSSWPSFKIDKTKEQLGFLTWGGDSFGDDEKRFGLWATKETKRIKSGIDSGPLVLMSRDTDSIVISHSSQFMATSAVYKLNNNGQGTVSWGILGSMKSIPIDFTCSVILSHSNMGPTSALQKWGKNLRLLYAKNDRPQPHFHNDYIGYWTDNGAYFYYNTLKNKTYEETLLAVHNYSKTAEIPYRYIELDSWWYYKSGGKEGVVNWIPQTGYFPSGLSEFSHKTNWTFFAHNRWWSAKNVYAKQNGGKYNFIIDEKHDIALPQDVQFWKDFFQNATKWGVRSYLQDWLTEQFDFMKFPQENITAARDWLLQLDEGLQMHNLPMQFCMTPCRTALQSLELKSVNNARVSTDYLLGEQWRIGVTSHFAWNLGIYPNKDNFFSKTLQPGNPFNKKEPYPAIHAVAATLSLSQVAIGDGIGMSDVALIKRTCNDDGLILSPSFPALAVDEQLRRTAFNSTEKAGEVTATKSIISGWHFGIVFAVDVQAKPYKLTPSILNVNPGVFWLNKNPNKIMYFNENNAISIDSRCTMGNFCLFYTAPVFTINQTKYVLLGEVDKFVPVSPKRIVSIEITNVNLFIKLRGRPREITTFTILKYSKGYLKIKCSLKESGTATINAEKNICE